MSESRTSHTKTPTETTSQSTDDDVPSDRWSNNISYRQLVLSSCVGIMQFWWHPYLQDPRAFVPFLFLYNLFSIFIGYPLLYLELALGIVSRKGVLRCWDIAPIARGVGWAMLMTSLLTAFGLGVVSAYCLALLVHSVHSFLPWLHCAAAAVPPCAARHRPLAAGSETPAQSFFHNFVLHLKRDRLESGMGTVVPELAIYYSISWLLVYFVAIKKIYSYSKLVIFKDSLAFFVIICSVIGACRLDGAMLMFHKCDWSILMEDPHIWRRAVEYALLEMTVSQGSLIMLGSYCPKDAHQLSRTAMIAFAVSKTVTMSAAFVLGATHGALYTDYGNTSSVPSESVAYSLILWSDFASRTPGSQFWSAIIFFTLFVLSTTSVALLVQTLMSVVTGKVIRKITWAFLILTCFLFCIMGTFTLCTQVGILILDFLMYWPISMPRVPIAAMVTIVVSYIYGQTTFCEDLYFTIGEYPNLFLRLCWAICPGFLVVMFFTGAGSWPQHQKSLGWVLDLLSLLPIFLVLLLYFCFRFRVRNITGNEK